MTGMDVKLRPGVVVALGFALIWSVALLVAAFVFPVYSVETTTDSGTTTSGASLVEVNGTGVIGIVAAPLVASIVVTVLVVMRRRRPVLGGLAWVAVAGIGVLALAGLPSIGLLMIPVVGALALAVALSRPEQVLRR